MAISIPGYADNLQPWCISVVTAVTVLALVSVGLRLLARWEKRQELWWDDYMIVWSMIWNLVVVGFIAGMLQYGMGIHVEQVPMEHIVMEAKFLLVAEILYVFNLVWTKLAILLMFYRIFRFSYFKTAAYIIGGFIIIWVITITFLFIFICVPVEKMWYPDLPGRCIHQVATWIANAASTILSDIAILVLPMPRIWQLQLRRAEKIGLTFAFGLGFFVVFASAYRVSVLFSYNAADPSYTLAPTVGWTAIEMSAGIVSACLPTLVPAIKLIARSIGLTKFVPITTKNNSRPTQPSLATVGGTAPHSERRRSINGKDGDFYRLSDDAGVSTDDEHHRANPKLRPDHNVTTLTVTSSPNERYNGRRLSGDEIPLNGIRVKTDFKQERS